MTDPIRMKKSGSTVQGDGPYREAPVQQPPDKTPGWIIGVIGGMIVLGVSLAILRDDPEQMPELEDVPGVLLDSLAVYPAPTEDLPPAVPLDPLLAADQPEMLSVMEPGPGAMRLQRNEPIHVRFNRPMVEGAQVGQDLDSSPIRFTPPIKGTATWSSRSRLIFHADGSAWNRSLEARMSFDPDLRSLDGSTVFDEHERVVVFDGTPHLAQTSTRTVSPGEALPLFFDNPVSAAQLGRDVMLYEVGGGSRSIPFALTGGRMEEQYYRVDLRPTRRLEEGASLAAAIAPRWTRWGGGSPSIVRYRVQPPPQITGVGCGDNAAAYGGCSYGAVPGRIVDIGPALRVLASEALREVLPNQVSIRPALRDMRIDFADDTHRVLQIRGEWAPDQVYEVRINALRTANNRSLQRFSPLAVRSAGHPPRVEVQTGRFAWEMDAETRLRFRGIHVGKGSIITRPVDPGDEIKAALDPAGYAAQDVDHAHYALIGPLAPDARPNQWGEGEFHWHDGETRNANMAVVQFRAGEAHTGVTYPTLFAQRTNLATTVRALPDGVLIWVTTLDSGDAVGDAEIMLADSEGATISTAETGGDGVAWIALSDRDLTEERFVVRAVSGNDRQIVVVEPGSALGPARVGLAMGGEPPPEGAPRASVFADRGAYRPGELVRVKAMVRSLHRLGASAYRDQEVTLRVRSPSSVVPLIERTLRTNQFGTLSGSVSLPASAALGTYSVVVAIPPESEEARETVVGSTSFRVAQFRQPTFRVDIDVAETLLANEAIAAEANGTYLFGAPVGGGDVSWSLVRETAAGYPSRWREMQFGPVDGYVQHGTIASGSDKLSAEGALQLALSEGLSANRRERLVLEVEVRDRTGQTTAAHRNLTLLPSAVEVGIKRGDDWVGLGEALNLDAIVIDVEGEPVAEQRVETRFVREGWHRWYEWARGGHGSGYQMRREQEREVVHTCALTSSDDLTTCTFTPDRPGTYVMEAEVVDTQGRRSLAQRRLYVAGPDEAPDRDPPGAPIAVTPTRRSYSVGEEAELAFESPWDDALALISIEQNGVVSYETREVDAGGQVIRVPLTEEMVPNAFIAVSLVRARTAPPGEQVDVHGPDLRFGAAEIRVVPGLSQLEVSTRAPERVEPGQEIEVNVHVDGASGPTEVALWMVDEGLLRLTDYTTPDPMSGLWPRVAPHFAWEDLRRALVARVTPPAERAGGDGGEVAQRTLRPDEPVLDPVPLWEPHLVTDSSGNASVRVRLPERTTEYRIIALAIDEGSAWGHHESQVVATRPVVLADALPRFLTENDRFEAAFFVHGTSDDDVTLPVRITVDGEEVHREEVTLRGRGQKRIAIPLVVEQLGSMDVELHAGNATLARTIPVAPRARWMRSVAIGGAEGEPGSQSNRELMVNLPPSDGGSMNVTVSNHPFVGLDLVAEMLESSPWGGLTHNASTVIGLAALTRVHEGMPRDRAEELQIRGDRAVRQLVLLQTGDGGFGRWTGNGYASAWEQAFAMHALHVGKQAGFNVPEDVYERSRANLRRWVEERSLADSYYRREPDTRAFVLRVLADADDPMPEEMGTLFDNRDQLGIEGLANLALAMDEDATRRATLVKQAIDYALVDHTEDDTLAVYVRHWDRRASVLGPLLEVVSTTRAGIASSGPVASELLKLAQAGSRFVWRTSFDAAHALQGIAAYAQAFTRDADELPQVHLDGDLQTAASEAENAARYAFNPRSLGGESHQLRFTPDGERPIFYAMEGEWSVPLSGFDRVARGRRVSLHRRFETSTGRQLRPGDAVELGEMVRVRLFVFTENSNPGDVMIHDPMGGGFEAVQNQFATTPQNALMAMLGMGPDDDAVDPRGYHAMRSSHSISHRALERNAAVYYFDNLPTGLQEYTYVVRATTVGEFTLPPAQVQAASDQEFEGRSSMFELRVVEELTDADLIREEPDSEVLVDEVSDDAASDDEVSDEVSDGPDGIMPVE